MNKTIYIKDNDAALWERARDLAEGKISIVIMEFLKEYVAEKEANTCKECGRCR